VLTFSIVIPNFNQSHFLPFALESLRYQSVPFRLAVMDGGSTDSFNEVVEEYSDIITYLRSAPDEGQAAAIRDGKDKVPGDVVAWLNADDYYFPGALDKVAACFEKDPELDISAYEGVGKIDDRLHYTMDWDLWCRLSDSGAKFKYIHEVLAAVRYYPETKTLSGAKRRYKEIYRIERKYGNKILPLSCLGSYYYGLTFKRKKTIAEQISFHLLSLLRRFKKRVYKMRDSRNGPCETNYGFHRWEPVVEGRGTIHLPWYDKRKWGRLYLRVNPVNNKYRIRINGEPCNYVSSEQGCLVVEVPALSGPYRKISIECLEKDRWKLLGFWCDLTKDDQA
jgi:glycosyltransferase involved in cell wall biosynthesis